MLKKAKDSKRNIPEKDDPDRQRNTKSRRSAINHVLSESSDFPVEMKRTNIT